VSIRVQTHISDILLGFVANSQTAFTTATS